MEDETTLLTIFSSVRILGAWLTEETEFSMNLQKQIEEILPLLINILDLK